jgi:hypothetical protein
MSLLKVPCVFSSQEFTGTIYAIMADADAPGMVYIRYVGAGFS